MRIVMGSAPPSALPSSPDMVSFNCAAKMQNQQQRRRLQMTVSTLGYQQQHKDPRLLCLTQTRMLGHDRLLLRRLGSLLFVLLDGQVSPCMLGEPTICYEPMEVQVDQQQRPKLAGAPMLVGLRGQVLKLQRNRCIAGRTSSALFAQLCVYRL
jgi:hypothetical protein